MSQSLAIGIDLGTTFSCVGVFQYGIVEIIRNDLGNRTTPSCVAFTDECRLTGDAAKSQLAENFENTVYDVKRLIGRRFNEFSVQKDVKNFGYKVINKIGKPFIKVKFRNEIKHFLPEEISAFVLTNMKKIAEDYLGTEITDAVITVPAYFNDSQRRATKDAGAIAGLNVLRIINEPTAAAIAYGLDTRTTVGEKNVLVFDLGGGTLDVTILSICDGIFEVKSTSGDTHLGGWDFDNRMVNYFVKEFQNEHQKKISDDKKALCRLRVACETAKLELSIAVEATINIVNLFENIDFRSTITRVKFENLCDDLFESTLVQVERALEDARFTKYELDEIVLVGGSTRIPKIQRLLKNFFDGKELNISIDPDTAIAYGAAVQASILAGNEENFQDLLLLDVTPLSLGVKTEGGIMTPLIKRNTTIPITEAKIFSTARDNQKSVLIEVFEGERALVRDNQRLGRFELIGFTPAPRLVPQIEVTFSIDANGILVVSAVERKSGKEQQISIKNNRSQSDIDQMISDGERHREQDEKYRQNNLARKQLLNLISQIELTLNQPTLSISSTDKNSIESIISEISYWLRSNENVEKHDIESRKNHLQSVCMSIIEKTKNMVDTTMNQLTESNEKESETDKHFEPIIEKFN